MTVAARMNDLGTESAFEVLAKARALEAEGKEIIHLEIGEPDFETPRHIVEAGMQAISDGFTHYGPTAGLPDLREAIARNSREVRGTNTDPANVVVTPGAKPIMFYVLLALAEPGVEVIYPNPGFPIYESGMITDQTRLIILNSPENPCGSALTKQELETIARVVMQHPDLYVLADEIYKDILYTGEHYSISSIPGMQERTIILDGFSKSYAMTGWRTGYGILPEELIPHVVKLAVNSVSCAASFTQKAAVAALEGPRDEVEAMVAEFGIRRRLITDGLRSIPGINCPEPEGAFYAFPSIQETGLTSMEFETRAMNEAGVALLSGSAFGKYGEGYVRLSYANSQDNIQKAISQLDKMVRSL